jgi:methyl-accepting chemotaxis protein
MQVSLRLKLFTICATGIAVAATVMIATWWNLREVSEDIQRMQVQASILRDGGDMDMMHDAIRGDAIAYFLARTDQDRALAVKDAQEHTDEFDRILAEITAIPLTDELRTALVTLTPEVQAYVQSVRDLVAGSDSEEELKARYDACIAQYEKLEPVLGDFNTLNEHAVEASSQVALAAPRTLLTRSLIVMGVGIAALAAIAWSISRSIVHRTRAVADAFGAMKQGNLAVRVTPTGHDEISTLMRDFNATAEQLGGLIRAVQQSASSLSAASTQIAASAEEMSEGIAKQQDSAHQVTTAVEEMNSTVQEVARKAVDAAAAAKDSQQDAASGSQVVHNTVQEIKGIAHDVSSSATAVSKLGAKSQQIGEIIKVINDIADQTNLLALNAAIEAARAGEHGRGFAVVADEVRKLAERTQKATEEVSTSIGEIQHETSTAVQLIESGSQRVTKGVDLANHAGQALGRITQSSQGLGAMVQSIAAATEEQSAASQQIARSVESINAITKESAQGSSQVAQAASDLSTQSETLQALVSKFRL